MGDAIRQPCGQTWLQYFVDDVRISETNVNEITEYLDGAPFAVAAARGNARAELSALRSLREAVGKYLEDHSWGGNSISLAMAYEKAKDARDGK